MTINAGTERHNISANHKVALALAKKGVRIFPCRWEDGPPGTDGHPQWRAKSPMPRIKWTTASTTDPDIINTWWEAAPEALIGMPLAPLNRVVIDPDQHPGQPDGVAAFDRLAERYPGLKDTAWVQTPQGKHYFYKQPAKRLGNAQGSLPPGINVRGDGGYVIAPGSMLPDGRIWELHDAELRELPQGVIDMISSSASSKVEHEPEHDAADNDDAVDSYDLDSLTYPDDPRQAAYMRATCHNAYTKLATATKGTRNATLNTQALKLGHFVPQFLVESEVVAMLRIACIENGLGRDDGQGSVDASIRSGLGDGKAEPRDPFTINVGDYWDGDFEQAFGEPPPKQGKPRIWRGDEMWDVEPVQYLLEGLIPRGTVGLMIGDSQTFKSFLALDMALTISQGLPQWHRHAVNAPEDAIVLYIAGEGGIEGISQRRRGWATWHKLTKQTMRDRFRLITHGVNLTVKESRNLLIEAIKEQLDQDKGKLVLIVVDTINTVASGADENSTKEMGALHNICVDISRQFNTAVMGVHHTNKAGGVRGSSVLTANMDFWLFIKRRVFSSMKIEMEIGKLKEAGAGHKEKYEMQLIEIDGSSITTLVPVRIGAEEDEIEPALGGRPAARTKAIIDVLTDVANGLTLTEICDLLGVTERKERQAVRRALYRGNVTGGFAHLKGKWSVTTKGGFLDE